MTIAVVIPTFNAASFLERTLDSVLAQTVPPHEVIVVDDSSTDGTIAIAERKRVHVIRLERNSGGPAVPMNRGIDAATSDWIVTLDHDDELVPDRIARLTQTIPRAASCGIVIGRLSVRPESQDRGHLLDIAWANVMAMTVPGEFTVIEAKPAYEALARHGCYAMSCSAMAFSKTAWTIAGGFDEKVSTCIDFAFLEAVLRKKPLGVIQAPVAYWTWSERNLSHDVHRRVFDITTVMERMEVPGAPPDVAEKLRRAKQDRTYYLTCRGEYRAAFRLFRNSPHVTTAVKCLAKVIQRQVQ